MKQKVLSANEVSAQSGGCAGLLTVKQAAAKFGVSTGWLYLHREAPSLRVGKGIRYIESDLIAYFKRQALRLQ